MQRTGSSPFHFSLKYLYKYFDLFWLEYLALVVRPWGNCSVYQVEIDLDENLIGRKLAESNKRRPFQLTLQWPPNPTKQFTSPTSKAPTTPPKIVRGRKNPQPPGVAFLLQHTCAPHTILY